jgi:hypothetical protein
MVLPTAEAREVPGMTTRSVQAPGSATPAPV